MSDLDCECEECDSDEALQNMVSAAELKKEMSSYNYGVIEWLMMNPVKNTPFIYELIEDDGKLIVIEEYFAPSFLAKVQIESRLYPFLSQ